MEATNSNLTSPSKKTSTKITNFRASEPNDQFIQTKICKKYSEDLSQYNQQIPQSNSVNSKLNHLQRKRFLTLTPLLTFRSNQEISLEQRQSLQTTMTPLQTNFKKLQKLGKGHQALGCYKCIDIRNENVVVVKEIKNNDEEICLQFKAEYNFIKLLEHEHIIKAIELILNNDSCQLVMEYAQGKPLGHYISKLKEITIIKIAKQLFSALSYLHDKTIMHRDLHFNNIIFDKNQENIKIIDFGIAKQLNDRIFGASCAGGLEYRAPEMLNYQPYTCKIDVQLKHYFHYVYFQCWQVGLILLQLVNHKKISSQRIIKKIQNSQRVFKMIEISDKLKQLIESLLIINPDNRISAKQAQELLKEC